MAARGCLLEPLTQATELQAGVDREINPARGRDIAAHGIGDRDDDDRDGGARQPGEDVADQVADRVGSPHTEGQLGGDEQDGAVHQPGDQRRGVEVGPGREAVRLREVS